MQQKIPQVYNVIRQLMTQFRASTKKVPRAHKYRACDECEHMLFEMMENVISAYNSSERSYQESKLKETVEIMNVLMLKVRVLHDLHFIRNNGFSAIIRLEESAMRQLCGWSRSVQPREQGNT